MKKIKSFKLFNGVESRLFESVDDTNEIISNVKDMLLELDFLDIDKSCELLPRVWNDGRLLDIIVINLWKKAIKKEDYGFRASYNWNDIKDVIDPVMEYLESEGFKWHKNKGTLAYNGVPIISTSGSYQLDNIKSKIEMVFIR
jgi:6-phosphogluconate dehydrogenase (decarboxylating)